MVLEHSLSEFEERRGEKMTFTRMNKFDWEKSEKEKELDIGNAR